MVNKTILASLQKDIVKNLQQNLPSHMDVLVSIQTVALNDNFEIGYLDQKVFIYCKN